MGATKTDYFTENQNQMSLLFKALGHPARISIIEHLLKVHSCISGDIVDELPLAQPTVSQHLKELKNAGLIMGSIEGNTVCYCLNPKTLDILKEYVNGISLSFNIDTCCK